MLFLLLVTIHERASEKMKYEREKCIPSFLKDDGGHDFFLGLLAKQVLPVLPTSLLLVTMGPVLLRSAVQQNNRDFTFSLILLLASAQEVDGESATETDTVM